MMHRNNYEGPGKDTDHDGRDAVEEVGRVTDEEGKCLAAKFGEVDTGEEADGKADDGRKQDDLALPTIALAMPPPNCPGARGSLVKKSRLTDLPPL